MPNHGPPIRETISLPHCWVCGRAFFGEGGDDPSVVKHAHHVVPRAAGGTDGPTVSLCTHHHDLLHRIAEAWMPILRRGGTPTAGVDRGSRMLAVEAAAHVPRVSYLSRVVAVSLLEVENDPNKVKSVAITLLREDQERVADLLKIHKRSREDLFLALLRAEHARVFPLKVNQSTRRK